MKPREMACYPAAKGSVLLKIGRLICTYARATPRSRLTVFAVSAHLYIRLDVLPRTETRSLSCARKNLAKHMLAGLILHRNDLAHDVANVCFSGSKGAAQEQQSCMRILPRN